MPKNLPWSKEEIVLALDLYFDPHRGPIDKQNPKIIELSALLNRLRATPQINDEEKFRNPNGVGLKLSNFLALDPSYKGKGMQSYSKLDAALFDKYSNNIPLLKEDALKIKRALKAK